MTRLRVSDHAVLRYLERAGGFEIEQLRGHMAQRIQQAWTGDTLYVRLDGFSFVIRRDEMGPVVTTVLQPVRQKRWRWEADDA
ncbi:hypothetical protein [Salipiger marinus]|uniref:hypothetical protein n=1 Tax=Salipiger marinus TaxID=555512 RepID=UPI00405900A2